jgi:RNA polymerase sigma-70 factor, ECF subfamily
LRLKVAMENLDEVNFIKRILDGETALFSYFLSRYSRPIHALVSQIIPCREDAEELTQDAFLKAFKKLDTFKGDCTFSTWLYRIAYNSAISETRKKKISFPALDESMMSNIPEEAVDELLNREDDEEMLLKLDKAIDCLCVEDKTLITLYYNEEKPISEVASILQLTPENVKVKLFRVRKKLYVMIKSNDNE